MTIVDTDIISVASVVDDKKPMNIDLPDSLFGNFIIYYHWYHLILTKCARL